MQIMLQKKKWNYELEVRAVYHDGNKDKSYWKKNRNNVFLKVNITHVDFGCLAHLDSHYLDALIALRNYNSNHNEEIKVRKYKMLKGCYRFELDRSFNYFEEIEKITNGEEEFECLF